MTVLDTAESSSYDAFHEWLLDSYGETLDQLLDDGGYFPELTEDPDRFDDLVPDIRAYLRETVKELPSPELPTYCHKDYRYGNLVVDSKTGVTHGVLDWANLMSAPPEFNLVIAESKLLKPDLNRDADASTSCAGELRRCPWDAYESERNGWAFDEATRERIPGLPTHLPAGHDGVSPALRPDRPDATRPRGSGCRASGVRRAVP